MFDSISSQVDQRLNSLEKHLRQENPVLLQVVESFRDLDRVAYRMGLLDRSESFATRVPWWPLVSILGTFSSGKSTFINSFLEHKLQRTGNQAVDDKFTVICFSKEKEVRTLPGLALDADPRFPFYHISQELEEVTSGEGQRIDAYLQLKTCPTELLRGKIIIDSPGFDADSQRNSTLRITDHIMNLSDLVLVFFDARRPEPGAMKDTLDHLVKNTIERSDSNKFLFILNQVDCTVADDNLEDVVAAWQRALSQSGLTAGRFFQIYNAGAAQQIDDEAVRLRYEKKRDDDLAEIRERIQRVEVERAYRIIGVLENTAKHIRDDVVLKLTELLSRWRRQVLMLDGVLFGLLGAMAIGGVLHWGLSPDAWVQTILWKSGDFWQWVMADLLAAGAATLVLFLHYQMRRLAATNLRRQLPREIKQEELLEYVTRGFVKNTGPLHSVFKTIPTGWGMLARQRVRKVLKSTDTYVQNLNDQFTNPSGRSETPDPKVPMVEVG